MLLGLLLGQPGPFLLLGAVVGLVAASSRRKPSVPRHLVEVGAFVRAAYRDGDIPVARAYLQEHAADGRNRHRTGQRRIPDA